jgi:hypothetical protein
MGESDRYQEYKHLRKKKSFSLGNEHNALMTLTTINAIFFLLLLTLQVVYFFYNQSAQNYTNSVILFFELPNNFSSFFQKPWTLFTYMFSDTSQGLWRLLSNLFWLWTFGGFFQTVAGNDKVIPMYLYGGVVAAFFFIIGGYFFPEQSFSLIGANAPVLAISSAATFYAPNYRILTHIRKGLPIWTLFLVYCIVDWAGLGFSINQITVAHWGCIITGVVMMYLFKNGVDAFTWMNVAFSNTMGLFTPKNNATTIRNKLFYNAKNRPPFQKKEKTDQDKIDALLDKINADGYDSLSEEEKNFLQKMSERDF